MDNDEFFGFGAAFGVHAVNRARCKLLSVLRGFMFRPTLLAMFFMSLLLSLLGGEASARPPPLEALA